MRVFQVWHFGKSLWTDVKANKKLNRCQMIVDGFQKMLERTEKGLFTSMQGGKHFPRDWSLGYYSTNYKQTHVSRNVTSISKPSKTFIS